MTKYRLPDALGGGEIEAEEMWGGCAGGRPEYILTDRRISITMPEGTPMEVVVPPLPPEPGMQAVVLDKWGYAWQLVMDGRGRWCRTINDGASDDWEELNRKQGPLTPLVPDPLTGAPELPFKFTDVDGNETVVEVEDDKVYLKACDRNGSNMVVAEIPPTVMGLALLRAAAEAQS